MAIAPIAPLPVLAVAPESMVATQVRPPVSRPPTVNAETFEIDPPFEMCRLPGVPELPIVSRFSPVKELVAPSMVSVLEAPPLIWKLLPTTDVNLPPLWKMIEEARLVS